LPERCWAFAGGNDKADFYKHAVKLGASPKQQQSHDNYLAHHPACSSLPVQCWAFAGEKKRKDYVFRHQFNEK